MKDFLLLFRGADWGRDMSPEDVQRTMDKIMAWFDEHSSRAKSAHPLQETGLVVSGKGGATVTDGPFAESKDAIGGYFLLQAEDYDEVLAIARANPALEFGLTIEIREIAPECPTFERIRSQLTPAAA